MEKDSTLLNQRTSIPAQDPELDILPNWHNCRLKQRSSNTRTSNRRTFET